ncbi:ABC transporter substrate-binding protein [Chlorobaculum sp. MV4-Y]|uniref:ABC transporter substrate-binding protein n=1 Tax=Chlorobaculum sp. MV4-Y TaxID=2976335 RepID=UPI0021AF0E00|nr:ABC transporter substrate-binding protein [Chlorobaculum sp. MV4-Y]UWX58404.1 ABC transporter substrate-binding protein [Chlorobaculum sp. MV4-Y]
MKKIIMTLLLLLFAGAAARAEGRIVSQSPYITDTLRSLGLENRIAGVSRYDDLDLPKTGGVTDPDPAAIAALHPGYLFLSDWTSPDVCKRVTPPGAKCVVLHGFKSMSEIGGNIRAICDVLGIEGGDEKAAAFERQWRKAAAEVNGGGRRVLILSSCQGNPFSFGVNTYLYDLFTAAGFKVVEDYPTIRHVAPTELIGSVWELVEEKKPEIVFVLQKDGYECPVRIPEGDYQIVRLDGPRFTSPSPKILDGLEELKWRFGVRNQKLKSK